MKLRFLSALLALLLIAGCSPRDGDTGRDNSELQQEQSQNQEQMQQTDLPEAVKDFAEHGLSFSVPSTWSTSGFEMEFDEVKNGNAGYDTRTFYALIDGIRTPVAMVSRFAKDQWDALVKSDPTAEDVKLGTSKDGNFVYTYLVKDDEISASDAGKKMLDTIRKEAKKLKDAIKITE